MSSSLSVSEWLGRLKTGDRDAAQFLWERYFGQLVRLARAHLPKGRRRAIDEEDIALSALDSFCRGAARNRFPALLDRRGLWPLLVTITVRKARKLARREKALKHGGGAVKGESALVIGSVQEGVAAWERILGAEPSPAFACQMAEECARLLNLLDDPKLRRIALCKLESYTNSEIAARLGCVETTIERKLQLIRSIWSQQGLP